MTIDLLKNLNLKDEEVGEALIISLAKKRKLNLNNDYTYIFSFGLEDGKFIKLEMVKKECLRKFNDDKFFSRHKRLFIQCLNLETSFYIQTPFYKKSVSVLENGEPKTLFFQSLRNY